jgi:hypothetical protein
LEGSADGEGKGIASKQVAASAKQIGLMFGMLAQRVL